jgi:hypothetical protein
MLSNLSDALISRSLEEDLIDRFLLSLPPRIAKPFEIGDAEISFQYLEVGELYPAKVLVLDCPEPIDRLLFLTNQETYLDAAARFGIRYIALSFRGKIPGIFKTFPPAKITIE